MNSFYQYPKVTQWFFAIFMIILLFILLGLWTDAIGENLWFGLLIFLLVPLLQFLGTPLFRLLGTYQYLSPMLLVFSASDARYDLHNGTSFDYLFVMRNTKPGIAWQQKILAYYIEGFLVIIDRIETGKLAKTVEVRGSSYFFSESTTKRLGFELGPTGFGEKLNIFFNYLDLLWMLSLSKGSLTFPNLSNIKTARTTGEQLCQQKARLLKLHAYLKR
ncbi:MAG: hypothetical protein AB8G15_13640 [Saprospiraceae bacterium]